MRRPYRQVSPTYVAVGLDTTDAVTDLDGTALHVDAQGLQALLQQQIEDMCLTHVAQLGMAMFVVGEGHTRLLDFLIAHEVEHTLADDDNAVVDTQEFAFHYRADYQLDNGIEGHFRVVEHLGDDHHRAVASRRHAEGKVTRLTTHGRHHKPVATRTGIFVNGLNQMHGSIFGGVIAEGRAALRQRKVVIDGLRHVDVLDGEAAAGQELRDAVGRRGSVVAADGDQQFDVVLDEELRVELFVFRFITAHLQGRTTLLQDGIGIKEVHLDHIGVGLEQVLVAFCWSPAGSVFWCTISMPRII